MKKLNILLLVSCVSIVGSGCYTTLKQTGNYYSEFDQVSREPQALADDAQVQADTEQVEPQESPDVTVNNYYSDPPVYYYPRYWNYPYGYGNGWYVSVGYPYYDPFYDPYYYYYGWCYYPTDHPTYCPDPAGPGTTYGRQRTFGSRRTYVTDANPFGTGAVLVGEGQSARVAAASRKSSSKSLPIQEERVRRNYRRVFGISESGKKESTAENKPAAKDNSKRETRTQNAGRAENSDRGRTTTARNDRPANSGRTEGRSERSSNQGRKYRN